MDLPTEFTALIAMQRPCASTRVIIRESETLDQLTPMAH